jgi:hypothetical protein
MKVWRSTILPSRLMTAPPPSLACRAPRVRATEYTPAVLRFQSGDCVTGSLEVFSSTGGLLSLQKPDSRHFIKGVPDSKRPGAGRCGDVESVSWISSHFALSRWRMWTSADCEPPALPWAGETRGEPAIRYFSRDGLDRQISSCSQQKPTP